MGTIKSKMGTNIEHKRKAKWAGKKSKFCQGLYRRGGNLGLELLKIIVDNTW